MFKCENCGSSSRHHNRVVSARKIIQHTKDKVGPRGGKGTQIVREIVVCDGCTSKIKSKTFSENGEWIDDKGQVIKVIGEPFNPVL
jgi:hypothetical protein